MKTKRHRILAEDSLSGVLPAEPIVEPIVEPPVPAAPVAEPALSVAELTRLQEALAESESRVQSVTLAAISELTAAALASNPMLPEALISGARTIAEFKGKLTEAIAVVEQVKVATLAAAASAAANGPKPHVASGSSFVPPPDISGMTPRQKLDYAIAERASLGV